MGFLDKIIEQIKDIPTLAVTRERLELASEQFAALERKVAELTKELETVKAQNDVLRERLTSTSVPDQYVRSRGVLWLRTAGGFDPEPYCPKCKIIMFEFPPDMQMHWNCSRCEMTAPYSTPPKA